MDYKIWYKLSKVGWNISEVPVTRSTKDSVWIANPPLYKNQEWIEKKERRFSHFEYYFEDLAAAKSWLKYHVQEERFRIETELLKCNKILEDLGCGKIKVYKFETPEPVEFKNIQVSTTQC